MRFSDILIPAISITLICLQSCNDNSSGVQRLIPPLGNPARTNFYPELGGGDFSSVQYEHHRLGDTTGCTVAPLSISSYQYIIATRAGNIVQRSSRGEDWRFSLPSGCQVVGGFAVTGKGNLAIPASNGVIYCLNLQGKKIWECRSRDFSTAAYDAFEPLTTQHGVVIPYKDGFILQISETGKIYWKTSYPHTLTGSPAADKEGNIYCAATRFSKNGGDYVVRISPEGRELFSRPIEGATLTTAPCIRNSSLLIGGMLTSNNEPTLWSISTIDGSTAGQTTCSTTPRFLAASPEGRLYVIGFNSGVGAPLSSIECFLEGQSQRLWRQTFRFGLYTPPLLAKKYLSLFVHNDLAMGIYILDTKGDLLRIVQLDEAPNLFPYPAIGVNGSITYCSGNSGIIVTVQPPFSWF